VDHGTVARVLQRAVAGLPVGDSELETALEHVEACEVCGPRFELWRADASTEGRSMAEVPVEPTALFARALTARLSDPEPVARIRAAERLASLGRLDTPALAALVKAAAADPDANVRGAALAALDEQHADVTLLVAEEGGAWNALTAADETGAIGEIERREDQLWMKLNRLPGSFEEMKPVLAVPAALEPGEAPIEWSGETPGLVFAPEPVAGGALEIYLGKAGETVLSEQVFSRVYLLSPREQRRKV
jgi:hypothetical protein